MVRNAAAMKARYVFFTVLRCFAYVLIACSLVTGLTPVSAFGAAAGAAPEQSQQPGDAAGNDSATPVIEDVGIFTAGTNTALAYASTPDSAAATISQKGGTLEFDSLVYWSTGDSDRNTTYVTWAVDDTSVATINNTGTLTAHADGTVHVTATVSTDQTGGQQVVATLTVNVTGQVGRYVTALRILDPQGKNITDGVYTNTETLDKAMVQFYAEADVYDADTGEKTTYSTANGTLSSQASDLADLVWNLGDSQLGYVDPAAGTFRPSNYGNVALTVSSAAGQGGATVSATTTVNSANPNPDKEQQTDGYHPQDSITVKAYYELYTPDDYGDKAYVINQTYTVDDIEAMGMVTATYTALGSDGYYTMTGEGAPLSTVLQSAGINIDGVKSFAFGTADWGTGRNRPVTADFVFGDRYYYPNIDIGSYADAKQVYPILAVKSNQVRNGSTDPDPDSMTEGQRFRLLFGSTQDGGNTQYQIKWINTLYVVLKGAPSVQPDDNGSGSDEPGPGSDSGEDNGGASDEPEEQAQDEGAGSGDAGGGSGQGTGYGAGSGEGAGSAGSGSEASQAGSASGGSATGDAGSEQASEGSYDAAQGSGSSDAGEGLGGGRYSIYQVMNRDDSDTDPIDEDNPYRPIALPLALLAVCAGGTESGMWYRYQTRKRFAQ